MKFKLTTDQLEKILKKANADDNNEDIIDFEIRGNRLIITQKDWGNTKVVTLMDKPC